MKSRHWPLAILLLILILSTSHHHQQVAARDAFEFFKSFLGSNQERPTTNAYSSDLERESSSMYQQQVAARSPAQILRTFRNGRNSALQDPFPVRGSESNLFKCVLPTNEMYKKFAKQYQRKFEDDSDRLERLKLFHITLMRAIVFNKIIQNEVTNGSNYQIKPQIGNYHFIEPVSESEQNVGALWYADITDCELGLIKHIIFQIIYLIERNDFGLALRVAMEVSDHLPVFDAEGFEQLSQILLLRLYDRFRGDEKMNQLFGWPVYMKKLAAYSYSLQESMRPNFKNKLALISFAYPAYFKDVKYNWRAINRTDDNLKANDEHKRFISNFGKNFANLRERNKRLVIFRQHWSLINQLNDDQASRFRNLTIEPDWSQIDTASFSFPNNEAKAEKLVDNPASFDEFPAHSGGQQQNRFKLTQFSDLTNIEFVSFLTNDFSLLANNKESELYLAQNFQVRPLDENLRNELATELDLRKSSLLSPMNLESLDEQQVVRPIEKSLARQVVDELIADVGLPIGPVAMENISEQEYYEAFSQVTSRYSKSYMHNTQAQNSRFVEPASNSFSTRSTSHQQQQLSDTDLADERQRRYEIFKENYARFKAWWIKEGWHLDQQQSVVMLRFADLSWHEIKVTLFKICCLTETNLELLSRTNATINYLGSNYQALCQQMLHSSSDSSSSDFSLNPTGSLRLDQLREKERELREMSALELYYYYSVHFNKHNSNLSNFNRKFAIFKKNVDSIRRHSCKRDLTLFNSLSLKMGQTLNGVDVLDSKRSYTDDLNLDRFEFHNLIKLTSSPQTTSYYATPSSSDVEIDRTRAGVSYRRRASFANLINRPPVNEPNEPAYFYSDKLLVMRENQNDYANKYKQLNVSKIYDFVLQRYRYCMKELKGIDLYSENLRQQCQSTGGKFEDKAARDDLSQRPWKKVEIINDNLSARLQDQCGYYRLGLEPWADGLMKQDTLAAQFIQQATCQEGV